MIYTTLYKANLFEFQEYFAHFEPAGYDIRFKCSVRTECSVPKNVLFLHFYGKSTSRWYEV